MKLVVLFNILIISPFSIFANWPIGKNRAVLNLTYNYYYASNYYDANGKILPFNNNGSFTSNSLTLNGGIGLGRYLDLIGSIHSVSLASNNSSGTLSKTGLADCSIGLAYHIPTNGYKNYLTIKALALIPGYTNRTLPYIGFGLKGMQIGLSYALSPAPRSYLIAEGYYNYYFAADNTGPAQLGYNIAAGTTLGNFFYASVGFNGLFSKSTNNQFSSNLFINKNFDYNNVSFSLGKRLTRNITVYSQIFYTYLGHNTGQGIGVNATLSLRLP